MNYLQKRRLYLVLFILTAFAVAACLALYALRQNIDLFFTPSQIKAQAVHLNHEFRLGGIVEKGSLQRVPNSTQVTFSITDGKQAIRVTYNGILPDLFREGQTVVVTGTLNAQGTVTASEVLAKHDERYVPAPLAGLFATKSVAKPEK